MKLLSVAKRYADKLGDVDALVDYMQALADETSVDEVTAVLSLGLEQLTHAALSRLTELRPSDLDLRLSIALWKYHLGLDDEAYQNLTCARAIAPFDRQFLQVEIFLSYGCDPEHLLSLCSAALAVHPRDEWLRATKMKLQESGQLTDLIAPPLNLRWQKLIFAAA